MEEGINILEHKYVQLRQWLGAIAKIRGLDSVLSIEGIYTMLDFLDAAEGKMDEIILKVFEEKK